LSKDVPHIENLEITKLPEEILFIHQIKTPFHFSCCDGLVVLPKEGRNSKTIVLDLNIEPLHAYVIKELFGDVSDYVCTHGHMDHIAHVYAWEERGAKIHAPNPESYYLTNLREFYEGYGFNEKLKYADIEKFGILNGYHPCTKTIENYDPGDTLTFENFKLETIPFTGHSKAHVGFYLPVEKILHVSCLGFDQLQTGVDSFGPWYGFRECLLDTYLNDIDKAELIYSKGADFLTSSHSYTVKYPDKTPFEYMRRKIKENQKIIDIALANLKLSPNFEDKIKELLKHDLYFPKRKMKGFLKNIYDFWEYWIIEKHLQRSILLK